MTKGLTNEVGDAPCLWVVPAGSVAVGCGLQVESSLTPEEQQTETDGVRAFMRNVAHDISKGGPAAWRPHFEDTPALFMAVNGALAFHDSRSATEGIQNVAKTFKSIELQGGDEIRVDPLTARFAIVATTYREVLTTPNGQDGDVQRIFNGSGGKAERLLAVPRCALVGAGCCGG